MVFFILAHLFNLIIVFVKIIYRPGILNIKNKSNLIITVIVFVMISTVIFFRKFDLLGLVKVLFFLALAFSLRHTERYKGFSFTIIIFAAICLSLYSLNLLLFR